MDSIKNKIALMANPEKARVLQGFFKTGSGEYGEGDVFLGLTSGQIKEIAKNNLSCGMREISLLLESKIHEERACALRILTLAYAKFPERRREIFNFYLQNTKCINNWDLVDMSSYSIVGDYLSDKDKTLLYNLAKSKVIWERRIAIVSTYSFIKKRKFEYTFRICEMLMEDKHDLIHKACGWMLREVGKKNEKYLESFLEMHYKKMPRTMLRYAIERFSKEKRRRYLKGEI